MVRKDGAFTRQQRIQEMTSFVVGQLAGAKGELPLSKTVALLAYKKGLTKDKVVEYLELAADLDRFVISKETDKILSLAKAEKSLEIP